MKWIVRLSAFSFGALGFWIAASQGAQAQEGNVALELYLFTMPLPQMQTLLQDGVTRAELDRLEGAYFQEGGLLPENQPLALTAGENSINLRTEEVMTVNDAGQNNIVVFVFHLRRNEAAGLGAGSIAYKSYIPGSEAEEPETIAIKQGTWSLPANVKEYRYFDFRYVTRVQGRQFNYELDIDAGAETKTYRVLMDFSNQAQ